MIADAVRLENDEHHYTLVIEDEMGTHVFAVDPRDVLDAVEGYRQHLEEGAAIGREFQAAGGRSWEAQKAIELSTWNTQDPEGELDVILEQVDLARKARREGGIPDPIFHNAPGDEAA